jgi:hypothetical protein
MPCPRLLRHLVQLVGTVLTLLGDSVRFLGRCVRSHTALAAEALFLRTQLAMYQERNIKPRRATHATRLILVWLGHWFDWRPAVAVVQPATFIRTSLTSVAHPQSSTYENWRQIAPMSF